MSSLFLPVLIVLYLFFRTSYLITASFNWISVCFSHWTVFFRSSFYNTLNCVYCSWIYTFKESMIPLDDLTSNTFLSCSCLNGFSSSNSLAISLMTLSFWSILISYLSTSSCYFWLLFSLISINLSLCCFLRTCKWLLICFRDLSCFFTFYVKDSIWACWRCFTSCEL